MYVGFFLFVFVSHKTPNQTCADMKRLSIFIVTTKCYQRGLSLCAESLFRGSVRDATVLILIFFTLLPLSQSASRGSHLECFSAIRCALSKVY